MKARIILWGDSYTNMRRFIYKDDEIDIRHEGSYDIVRRFIYEYDKIYLQIYLRRFMRKHEEIHPRISGNSYTSIKRNAYKYIVIWYRKVVFSMQTEGRVCIQKYEHGPAPKTTYLIYLGTLRYIAGALWRRNKD